MKPLHLSHSETRGSELHLRYAAGVNVTVGRIVRDSTRRPSAEVVIDIDSRLAPERDRPRIYRGSLGLLSRSGIKGCVDLCRKRVESIPWDELIDNPQGSQRLPGSPRLLTIPTAR